MRSLSEVDRSALPRDADDAALMFQALPPGGSFAYFVGDLATARHVDDALDAIASMLLLEAQAGRARLTQERTDKFAVYVYRCHKRAVTADFESVGRAAAQRRTPQWPRSAGGRVNGRG